jgi:hypothetical protein
MAGSILELIFKTSKQGQGGKLAAQELKSVKDTVGDLSSNFLGFNAASLTAAGAVAAVGAVAVDSVKKFMNYGEEIRGLTALTGTSAEETSRMMQAFDDLGISTERFGTIVEQSAKKGFVFTLENVKALAVEYNNLGTMQEKNKLLTDRLGKSGLQLAKVFAEGGDAIEKYYNAVSDGLVMTDAEVESADKLRRNIDNLNDSWTDFTMTLTGPAVEALNEMFERQQAMIQLEEERGRGVRNLTRAQQDAAIAEMELADSAAWVAENADKAKQMLGGYGDTAADLPGDLDAATAAQENLNNSLKAYNTQLLYNVATEGMDAEAKLQIAYGLGLVDEKSRYAIVKTQEWKELLEKGKISIDEYNRLVWDLAHGLSGIQSKDVEVRIHYYETHGGTARETGGRASGEVGANGYANGTDGWVTVPAGYPGDTYMVPMSSGERYQVQNDRQRWTGTGGQGGGGPLVKIDQVVISNGLDQARFERMLEDTVRRGQRG